MFPITDDLRVLLDEPRRATKELERQRGIIIPWIFYRMVAKGRDGEKEPRQGVQQSVEGRVQGRGLPRPHPARLPPRRRPQHGPARRA